MDKNKLTELRAIHYEIPKTCGLCKHGVFVGAKDMGGCAIRTYEHLKHTGAPRQLSIYRGGSCPDKWAADEGKLAALGAYAEFVSQEPPVNFDTAVALPGCPCGKAGPFEPCDCRDPDKVEVVVQVNGKLRGNLSLSKKAADEAVVKAAVKAFLTPECTVKNTVYIPGKILNLVV